MDEKRTGYISIGEMAKMNRTTVPTLRLYDSMKLLTPCYVDEKTHYRYYDIKQNARLDMIQYMKELGIELKEIKSIKEQIDTCPADRTELLEEYNARLAVMSEFAPKMLSEDEVRTILNEKFADVIATKNKGQIMKAVMSELKGKADGKVINAVVAEMCK